MKEDRLYLIHSSCRINSVSSAEFKATHPEIEWYKIAGLRNILVHDYLGIDMDTVWLVVKNNLPELHDIVRTALESDPHTK